MGELTAPDAIALAALSFATMKILTGPIGRAIADRLRGGRGDHDVPAIGEEVDMLRTRLVEIEERLDYAERLLTGARQADQITGGTDR
jgi:hypothetical protein